MNYYFNLTPEEQYEYDMRHIRREILKDIALFILGIIMVIFSVLLDFGMRRVVLIIGASMTGFYVVDLMVDLRKWRKIKAAGEKSEK